MDWLARGWDQSQAVAAGVGLFAGLVLVVIGSGGLAALAAPLVAIAVRWSMWQIPPPGRSRASGAPRDALSQLGRVAVAVLLLTLTAVIVASALP